MLDTERRKPLPRVYLHIGTHRTGSTTLQSFLGRNRQQLLAEGIEYYRGSLLPDNHIELYLTTLDPGKETLARSRTDLSPDEDFTTKTRQRVHSFLASSTAQAVIFSTEGLSLLRAAQEMERLGKLFDPRALQVTVVLVLRDRASYLASYRRQILKTPGRRVSRNKTSALYVGHDSWLADFESLVSAYASLYESGNMRILDYDFHVAKCGDLLPALLQALSVPAHLIPPPGLVTKENRSSWRTTAKGIVLRLLGPA